MRSPVHFCQLRFHLRLFSFVLTTCLCACKNDLQPASQHPGPHPGETSAAAAGEIEINPEASAPPFEDSAENATRAKAEIEEAKAHAWSRLGQSDHAAFHFRKALEHRKKLRDRRWEISDRNLLGLELRRLGKSESARRQFNLAEELAADTGFLAGYSAAINNRGLLEEDAGNFALARGLYRRAWRTSTSATSIPAAVREATLFRENLARLALTEGDFLQAESLLNAIVETSRAPACTALAELAWVQLFKKETSLAMKTLNEALPSCSDPPAEKLLLDRRGTALVELGQYADAAAAYHRSLNLMPSSISWNAATLTSLCRLHTLDPLGSAAAGPACALALDAAEARGIPSTTRASTLYWRAHQLLRDGRREEARLEAAKAADLVSSQPSGGANPEDRSRFLDARADYLQLALDLALEEHRLAKGNRSDLTALAELERWRARAISERIDAARDDPALHHLLQKKRRLLRELVVQRVNRREESPGSPELDLEIEALDEELAAKEVSTRRQKSKSLPTAANASLNELSEVQGLLDEPTQIFDLVLGEQISYLWRIRRHNIESFELPAAALLENEAQSYLALIANPFHLSRRSAALVKGRWITETLFGKNLEKLEGGGNRLVFVGDGVLTAFPIAALPAPAATPESPRYLVEDFEIVHLPSLPTLRALRRPRSALESASRTIALVGDPWYDARSAEIVLKRLSPSELVHRLGVAPAFPVGRLPFSAIELDRIVDHLRSHGQTSRIDGPAAGREVVVSNNLEPYAIVHFSAHGLAERKTGSEALLLSQVDGSRLPLNGRLTVNDLEGLNWRSELVVLSSCQGIHRERFRFAGSGGLARGFLLAGSRRTLAALWNVEGASTAALMDAFYGALVDRRMPPAAALQFAQRSILDRARASKSAWQAPYYWSGFVLSGDWRGFSYARRQGQKNRSALPSVARSGRARPTTTGLSQPAMGKKG